MRPRLQAPPRPPAATSGCQDGQLGVRIAWTDRLWVGPPPPGRPSPRVRPGQGEPRMTRVLSESHPLHRLFRGLAEHTFMAELGIGDPGLVGYVANLLARFVRSDAVWHLRDEHGRRLEQV